MSAICKNGHRFYRRTGERHPHPYSHWVKWEPVWPVRAFGIVLFWLPSMQEPFYLDDDGFVPVSRWTGRP